MSGTYRIMGRNGDKSCIYVLFIHEKLNTHLLTVIYVIIIILLEVYKFWVYLTTYRVSVVFITKYE